MTTYTEDQVEILREAGEAWLDWGRPGGWITIDPGGRPVAFGAAEELADGGALDRGHFSGQYRLSTKSRLALAAALAPDGRAGAVLKRPLGAGRRRTRRKGSR